MFYLKDCKIVWKCRGFFFWGGGWVGVGWYLSPITIIITTIISAVVVVFVILLINYSIVTICYHHSQTVHASTSSSSPAAPTSSSSSLIALFSSNSHIHRFQMAIRMFLYQLFSQRALKWKKSLSHYLHQLIHKIVVRIIFLYFYKH